MVVVDPVQSVRAVTNRVQTNAILHRIARETGAFRVPKYAQCSTGGGGAGVLAAVDEVHHTVDRDLTEPSHRSAQIGVRELALW